MSSKRLDPITTKYHKKINENESGFQSIYEHELSQLHSDYTNLEKLQKSQDGLHKAHAIMNYKIRERNDKIQELRREKFKTEVYIALKKRVEAHTQKKEASK